MWIATQHKRLHIEKRASRGAQIDFVSPNISRRVNNVPPDDLLVAKQVHDLSNDHFSKVSVSRSNDINKDIWVLCGVVICSEV